MEKTIDGILLIGSQQFIINTENALDLIKKTGKKWIDFVRSNIGIISEQKQSGMMVYTNPPNFNVGKRTYTSSITWYSSAIIHDANHSYLFKSGIVYYGCKAERRCMELQLEFLKACSAPNSEIDYLKHIYETGYDYYSNPIRDW